MHYHEMYASCSLLYKVLQWHIEMGVRGPSLAASLIPLHATTASVSTDLPAGLEVFRIHLWTWVKWALREKTWCQTVEKHKSVTSSVVQCSLFWKAIETGPVSLFFLAPGPGKHPLQEAFLIVQSWPNPALKCTEGITLSRVVVAA